MQSVAKSIAEDDQERIAREHIKAHLGDRRWRLNNLYRIQTKADGEQRFVMNAVQERLLEEMHFRNVILKARQLGLTTFIAIFALDMCLFNSNQAAGFIAHNREDAEDIFTKKIRFAYDNLPDWLREAVPAVQDSVNTLRLANGSSIRVGTSLRSGTYQILHVSEMGKIAFKYPEKAIEVITGAIPTVPVGGFVFIESTFEGGKGGEFYKLIVKAMEMIGRNLGPLDLKFHFFPWYSDQGYRSEGTDEPSLKTFFAELKEQGVRLDSHQRAWYSGQYRTLGHRMQQEYPSNPEEAMNVQVEGAYYGKLMTQARAQGRICGVPWEPAVPVFTFWDLGIDDSMTIWFVQFPGREVRLIDYFEACGEGFPYYKAVLDEKRERFGYVYGQHFAPHDISVREMATGLSRMKSAADIGIIFERVPVVPVDIGISASRDLLPRCYFDKTRCEKGINCLEAYHAKADDSSGVMSAVPVHDWASHGADSFRTLGVAMKRGQIRDAGHARRVVNVVFPRAPDGSVIDDGRVLRPGWRRANGLAISGHTPFGM